MGRSISELVVSFSSTSFQARRLAQCVDVYRQMLDEGGSFTIFMGISGALIAAGLRKILADMIRLRLVDVIVTTGAVIYQDYYQSMGHSHFRGKPDSDDVLLHGYMIDRIYDTYVDEEKFRQIDMDIGRIMDKKGGGRYSTREFLHSLGERCVHDDESILGNARKGRIPIYCPAIADSSIGIGLSTSYRRQRGRGGSGARGNIRNRHHP